MGVKNKTKHNKTKQNKTKQNKTNQNKNSTFNKWCCQSACRRMQIDPFLSPLTKLKSKWTKDFHNKTRHTETNRKENGEEPWAHGHKGNFPEQNTYSLCCKIKNWQVGPHKIAKFCKAKDTVNRTKQQPTDWEKIFTNLTSDRGLISNIYKELKKLDFREPNNPI